jgi:hypothetical protein
VTAKCPAVDGYCLRARDDHQYRAGMKKLIFAGLASTLAVTVSIAHAGQRYDYSLNVTATSASGAVASVRNSADFTTFIECALYGKTAVCTAHTTDGTTKSCSTSDPTMVANARALNGDSYLSFSWDSSGACKNLNVTNGSVFNTKLLGT